MFLTSSTATVLKIFTTFNLPFPPHPFLMLSYEIWLCIINFLKCPGYHLELGCSHVKSFKWNFNKKLLFHLLNLVCFSFTFQTAQMHNVSQKFTKYILWGDIQLSLCYEGWSVPIEINLKHCVDLVKTDFGPRRVRLCLYEQRE